ncbi:hypothetical protein [Virgibacillus halodenitrificans]|uniref:hypothetical protein n=1 Tax=Virgibacillus halodenitrificans TaxID=1482 RepID=UPI000EF55BD1|nr:hypothetical protein [Virgibacillus halodenitrificans]
MIEYKKLLDEVMVRLEKQFLVPATYTIKGKSDGTTDVHLFLHGTSASHYSSIEFIAEMLVDYEDDLRKVNELADYFIEFFIHALQAEEEVDTIQEVTANLAYVYKQMVQAHRWYDEQTNEDKVSFIPFRPEIAITLKATQLKEEYEQRFDSEETPDILVDLKDMIKAFETEGIQAVKEIAKTIDRSIEITKLPVNKALKYTLY